MLRFCTGRYELSAFSSDRPRGPIEDALPGAVGLLLGGGVLAGSDGVEDDLDGSLTGRVVRDHLELPVVHLVEDRCVVVGAGELDEFDVVARVAHGTGKPLRLPCRACRVLVTGEQVDVGVLVAPAG
jgi:hypothetical protein